MLVARMIPDKGADVLLRAAAEFTEDDIEIVIVGSEGFDARSPLSRYELDLRELARDLEPEVHFMPFVDRLELPALLRTADVLAVPSRWAEPSGLTVGEGLATGLPVIAAEVGGIPEVLGPAGIRVPADDPHSLASALRQILDDSDLRLKIGREARAHSLSHDWGMSWRSLRAILEESARVPAG
jgi:glycosyltransferase involved in cell wall biosynthesis